MSNTMDGLPEKLLIERPSGIEFPGSGITSQRSLKQAIGCVGVGLHSGLRIALQLLPAPVDTGIVFRRTDLGADIPALFDHVVDTQLCTMIGTGEARVGTVEHLMAALAGCGVDNVFVELDGPEVPVLDGSADEFVFLLDCAGIVEQAAPRRMIEVLRPVRVQDGRAFAELRPSGRALGLDLSMSIAFEAPAIGRQALSMGLSPSTFRRELARARTFTQAAEVAGLQAAGLALGGTLENAVVVDGDRVLNPGGLRMADEFVRHKMLDAIGDLGLAGAAICGRLVAHRSGHRLNNLLLRALFADASAWRFVVPDASAAWLSAA